MCKNAFSNLQLYTFYSVPENKDTFKLITAWCMHSVYIRIYSDGARAGQYTAYFNVLKKTVRKRF